MPSDNPLVHVAIVKDGSLAASHRFSDVRDSMREQVRCKSIIALITMGNKVQGVADARVAATPLTINVPAKISFPKSSSLRPRC